jgi:hypothetical protein
MRSEVRQPLNHRHAKIQNRVRILKARPWHAALQDYQLLSEAKIVCDQNAFGWTAAAIAHSTQRSIDHSPCC